MEGISTVAPTAVAVTVHTWHYSCQVKSHSRSAFLLTASCLEKVWVTGAAQSHESFGNLTCLAWTLRSLVFTAALPVVIWLPSTVQQCESGGSDSKVWVALTLYCSCPPQPLSILTNVWNMCCGQARAFVSLNQTVLLCEWWAHAGGHFAGFFK